MKSIRNSLWTVLIAGMLLGLVTFTGGKRFAIFLGPFVGVGYGYLIALVLSRLSRKAHPGEHPGT